MDFKQLQNTVKTLVRNDITSVMDLQRLTDEDIMSLNSVGTKKIKDIKYVKELSEETDVFELYSEEGIKPKRFASFFNQQNLYEGNILQTKLHTLSTEVNLTKGRIDAFLSFKNDVFRNRYNETLDVSRNQNPSEISNTLISLIISPLRKYLSNELLINIEEDLEKMIIAIQFNNVDLHTYGKEIATYLDYEYLISKIQNNFDKEILYQVIFKERKEFNMFTLKQRLLALNIFEMQKLSSLLQELQQEGFIKYTSHGLKHQYPIVIDYVKHKITEFPHLYHRLKGKTLEEIGIEKGLTRERIRQLVNKEVKNIPVRRMYEWRFVEFYKKYNLSIDEFCQIFNIQEEQYNFLKIFFYNEQLKEQYSKEELLDSNQLGAKEQEELLKLINKNYIIINNHRLKKNKHSIVAYAVTLFAKNTIHLKDFQEKLLRFCTEQELDNYFDFTDTRALEGILSRVENALWKYGRELRYFAQDKHDVIDMLHQLSFKRYMNQEISARRILIDYADIFEEIEIFDEYELHNLFKKYESWLPQEVSLKRMPLLEVGKSNREEQLLNLLIEHSSIHKHEFAELYSEKYGVLLETVKANYIPMLREFEENDILDADTPVINQQLLKQLNSILTEDFYFKEDVYQLYEQQFGEDDLRDYMFHFVDYLNYAEFILKKEHKRADVYFEEQYFSETMFTIKDNRLKYLGSFRKRLESLRYSLDIFEYAENEFIRIETIHQKTGITKDDIQQLITEILNEVGDKYFTIPMIEPIIENSPLYVLGFDDIFYESILKGNKHLRFQYMGGRVVFRKAIDKFYIHELIEETVSRFKYIDIYELQGYLNDEYFVSLSTDKIIRTTEMTNLYYHPVLEMMFQDIEQFYEFIEEE